MARFSGCRSTVVLGLTPFLAAVLSWPVAGPADAAIIVENCSNDAALSTALLGGGTITFDCGVATIPLSSTKTISVDTTIDGGGKITLSGGDTRRLFIVDPSTSLDLKDIVLTNGKADD